MHGEESTGEDAFLVHITPIVDVLHQRVFSDFEMMGVVDALLKGDALFVREGTWDYYLFGIEEHGDRGNGAGRYGGGRVCGGKRC